MQACWKCRYLRLPLISLHSLSLSLREKKGEGETKTENLKESSYLEKESYIGDGAWKMLCSSEIGCYGKRGNQWNFFGILLYLKFLGKQKYKAREGYK